MNTQRGEPERRSYGQYCALARALDIVGERWTLLVVRELMLGPRRFTDLAEGLGGVGPSLLAERLKHLTAEGIVSRRRLPPPAASRVYELTEDGRALSRALMPLVAWGARRLGPKDPDEAFNAQWLLLGIQGAFDPVAATGVDAVVDFDLEGNVFYVAVRDGALSSGLGAAPDGAQASVTSDLETFVAVATRRLDPVSAAASGRAHLTGDAEALGRLLGVLRAPG